MNKRIFVLTSLAAMLLGLGSASGQYGPGRGRGSGRWDEGRRDRSSEDDRTSTGGSRKYYRFKTAHERLPKGMPDWFMEKDRNGDGQVFMSEFAVRWTDALVKEFVQFDRNGDGIVTPKECLAARAAGAVYEGDSTPVKSAVKPPSDSKTPAASGTESEPKRTAAPPSIPNREAGSESDPSTEKLAAETPADDEDVEIPEAYLKHAVSYIRMYDTDGNGALTSDEWEKMRKSPQAADCNGDNRVTPREYAMSIMKR